MNFPRQFSSYYYSMTTQTNKRSSMFKFKTMRFPCLMTLKQLLLLLLVLYGVQQSHGNERKPRSPKFTGGPNGDEPCILSHSSDERFYEYTNEDGRQCKCDLCDQGKILVQNCTICDPVTPQSSICDWVQPGVQRMPFVNKCTTGFDCKQCPHPSRVKRSCSTRGHRDTICECPDGFFKAQEDVCKPYPRCDAGSEPRPGPGGVEAEMICQRCSDGFFQPNHNSTDRCRIHTDCIKVVGTKTSDNVCQNYQSAVSSSPQGPFPDFVTATSAPTTAVPTTAVPANIERRPSADDGNATVNETKDAVDLISKQGTPSNYITWWGVCLLLVVTLGIGVMIGVGLDRIWINYKGSHQRVPTNNNGIELKKRSWSRSRSFNDSVVSSDEETPSGQKATINPTTSKGKRQMKKIMRNSKQKTGRSRCCTVQ